MPYIKKIELKGFKSFGPKTATVTLDRGFTAVTGPNGMLMLKVREHSESAWCLS